MSSIHTNAAAISAVQILMQATSSLASAETEVSSGFRIQTAADTVDAGTHSAGVSFPGLRIDKGVIDLALGTTDGAINNASQLRAVLQRIFQDNLVPATAYETLFTGTSSSNRFEIGSLETSGEPGSSINISNVI